MTKELLQRVLVEVECYLRHGKMEQPNALAADLRAALFCRYAAIAQPEPPVLTSQLEQLRQSLLSAWRTGIDDIDTLCMHSVLDFFGGQKPE